MALLVALALLFEPGHAADVHAARRGGSRDLLCPLASRVSGPAPPAFADAPLACSCAVPRDRCRLVAVGNDRRRALLLDPGTRFERSLALDGASELRFSVAAHGSPEAVLDVRVRVAGAKEGASHEWHRRVGPLDRWVDVRLPLDRNDRSPLRLTIESVPRAGRLVPDALALAAPRLVRPITGAAPRNVVVYVIDTLRADHTTPYGATRPTTPRLAALAREGVVFENAYTIAPWTRPATASLLTGLYPSAHGTETSGSLSPAAATLAERFRRAGWSTWAFVANGHVFGEGVGFEQGFDRFFAVRGRRLDNHARSEEIDALVFPQLAAFGDEPFLLYVHAVDPHSPYDPPPGFRGRFSDASYAGSIGPADTLRRTLLERPLDESDVRHVRDLYDEDIAYQDDRLGALLDRLAEEQLLGRTIVVVVSDHGEELHDHGDWEHGQRLFEEQVRVPLVLRVPDLASAAGRHVAAPVQIVDVLPTLLTLAGIRPHEPVQGADLLPVLTEHAADAAPRAVWCEEIRPSEDADLFSLRDGRWKIIREVPHDSGVPRDALFDLESDPGEHEDLATRQAERLGLLRERLERMPSLLAARAPRLPAAAPAAPSPETRRQLEALGYATGDGR